MSVSFLDEWTDADKTLPRVFFAIPGSVRRCTVQQRSVRDLMRIRHGLVVTETSTLREVAERLIISDCDSDGGH